MPMSKYWSPRVHTLKPYVAGEQPLVPGLVKLNTNECPYGPSPRALAAIQEAAGDALRLYPDPDSRALRQAVAKHVGLASEQVFLGNGSDEILAHVFQALLSHEAPTLFPDVTYGFYPVYCGLFGIPYRTVPLTDAYEIDLDAYDAPNGGVVFANPNAPTGVAMGLDRIESFLRRNTESVVVIDEAYVDFGAQSAARLVDCYPNLVVVQTFSKSRSLAGMRIGFALAQRELIEALERVKNSFNSYPVSRLASVAGVAAIEDDEHFKGVTRRVMASRAWLSDALEDLGFHVVPSAANFVFATHPGHEAAQLYRRLKERGVLVRHFASPRTDAYLRITVGTPQQCERLVDELKALGLGVTAPSAAQEA
jgi:histidinol-phosphate aminotransferase